jgi:hypothetical protein
MGITEAMGHTFNRITEPLPIVRYTTTTPQKEITIRTQETTEQGILTEARTDPDPTILTEDTNLPLNLPSLGGGRK